jgi:hypothetical protein
MSDTTPYYLEEAWCREHGRKGPAQLAREFKDTERGNWKCRRQAMRREYPDLVPMLDQHGRPIGTLGDAPEQQDGGPSRDEVQNGFESVDEVFEDGRQTRTRLLPLTKDELSSPEKLLEAHGFDPELWTLERAVNKAWNLGSRNRAWEQRVEDHQATGDMTAHVVSELYASTITVRPKVREITAEDIAEVMQCVQPVTIKQPKAGSGLLELGTVDMHLGNSTLDWYRANMERIVAKIRSRKWAQIIIPVGSDFYHVDNFKNTTSNGTAQSSVDWMAAVADGSEFMFTIIEAALKSGAEVFVYYEIGNHDESQTWMFCVGLSWKYPQVKFDLAITERKVHRFGNVAIGLTHGDSRNRKDLDRVFMSEFPEFASATVREVHAAHYHHEMSVDQFGVVTRSLSTAARTDKWHREEGFVGAMKRFMLFSYDTDALTAIDYV